MQTVKGVKVRCIKLLKNKVYKFARYTKIQDTDLQIYKKTTNHNELVVFIYSLYG